VTGNPSHWYFKFPRMQSCPLVWSVAFKYSLMLLKPVFPEMLSLPVEGLEG